MSRNAVEEQIRVIKEATKEAIKTRESAIQFLKDARIYEEKEDDSLKKVKKSSKGAR